MFEVHPDFIVIGARTLLDGRPGVQLTASNDVGRVDIEWNFEPAEFTDVFDLQPPRTISHADLRAKLRTFAMTYAPDYRTAWEHLMRMGNPDDPQARKWSNTAVDPPRLQLPPGT